MSNADPGVTRYAALTRRGAAGVFALWLGLTGWLLWGSSRGTTAADGIPSASRDASDVALYRAVVARTRAEGSYYDAAATELRARHYPTRPVFNWRQPTYAWLLSRLPDPRMGSAILALVGAAFVWLTRQWVRGTTLRGRSLLATALMTVTMSSCLVTNYVYLQESWAGFLVALSIGLFALDLWPAAVAASLAALAFRELALLPCVVGLLIATRRRRWSEVKVWLAGLAIYGGLMAWHVAEVARRLRPNDLARGWVAVGGSSFILATCQWNSLLVMFPRWAVALILPLLLLGLAGWRDVGAARAAFIVFGYLAVFSVVGNAFNDYWGSMYAPLLSLGLLAAPDSVRDLARAMNGADAARAG